MDEIQPFDDLLRMTNTNHFFQIGGPDYKEAGYI